MKKIILILSIFYAQINFCTIIYNPTQPNVEQNISFNVTHIDGIYPPSVFWDFGDGTNGQGSTSVNKSYTSIGNFLVTVNYRTLKEQNVTEQITINVVERRRITFTPSNPILGRDITFRAENFLSNDILWDFGDGSEVQCLQKIVVHRYERVGRYTVTARDWCGNSVSNIFVNINIGEEKGPRAPFQISYIQIRFEDGKPYKSIIKDSPNLVAYADIKYEGTGLLIAQWEVDGVLFKQVNRILPYAAQTTIDSGNAPSLPTNLLGLHDVTLRIIQPQTQYEIPIIRYFVSAGKYEIEKLEFPKIEAKTLEGEDLVIEESNVIAPKGKPFIIKGNIKNTTLRDIKFALLRIYVEEELIDQKLIKDFKQSQDREFETSLLYGTYEGKRVYVIIYDITEKPQKLLFLKKFLLKEK